MEMGAMKYLWLPAGFILGVGTVLGIGILEIQRIGAEAGAQMNLDNEVVRIIEPGLPVLPLVGLVAIGFFALTILNLIAARLWRSGGEFLAVGFGLAGLLAIAIWLLGLGGLDSASYPPSGIRPGIEGWVAKGAGHPLTMVLTAVALFMPVQVRWLDRRR